MQAKNKWNNKLYTVTGSFTSEVKLQREDGSEFTISKAEFYANYKEVKYGKTDNN